MNSKKQQVILESGKRKSAIARATIKSGNGKIRINRIPLEIFVPDVARMKIMEPIILLGDLINDVDINVKVQGGGYMGQAEAARMAIARAITTWFKSSSLKNRLQNYDRTMFSGDPRRKEPKKFGGPGARTKKQKSYR